MKRHPMHIHCIPAATLLLFAMLPATAAPVKPPATASSGKATKCAERMNSYFTNEETAPRWYIAPKEGPLVGSQNFWFVTPGDVLPGDFSMGAKETTATEDGVTFVPFSVVGKYTYRLKVLGQDSGDSKMSEASWAGDKLIQTCNITPGELKKVGKDQTLLIEGTVTAVLPDEKGFKADVKFSGGPVPCEFQVLSAEKTGTQPDIRSRHYGPHWEHTFDVYYPEDRGDGKLPVIFSIHGGGWNAFDKSNPLQLDYFLGHGYAVVSVNYRYISASHEHPAVTSPIAAPHLDVARCLQYVRAHADELGLDKTRIATTGGSAGAATALWLALHDDMADPDSKDPVARESTKPNCAFPLQGQTSMDPILMSKWVPGIVYGGDAFFFGNPEYDKLKTDEEKFQYFLDHRDEIAPFIEEFSAYEWASADDPPILNMYSGQRLDSDEKTHSPKFGIPMQERLKELGVESWFFADDVPCENPRYNGMHSAANFTDDMMPAGK